MRRLRGYLHGESWTPLLALGGLYWADQVDTRTFEVLGPEIGDSFHVGEGTIGTIGILSQLLAPVVGLGLAYFADRRRRMPFAIGAAVVWSLSSVLTGLAWALPVLIVLRVIATSGEVVNTPVHGSLLADSYTPQARMKAFGVYQLAGGVGGTLGGILAGALGDLFDWRVAFSVLAVPTFVVIFFARRLPEPPRGQHETVPLVDTPPFREGVRAVWRLRSLRYMYLGTLFAAAGLLPTRQIFSYFLRDEFGVSASGRGVIIGIGTGLTFLVLVPGSTWMQRRLDHAASDALQAISRLGLACGVLFLLLAVAPSVWLVVPLVWALYVLFQVISPALIALVASIASAELRSTALALSGVVTLGGVPFALVGVALGSHHQRFALFYLGVVFLIGIRYFFLACRYVDADVARLDPARQRLASAGVNTAGQPLPDVLLQTQDVTVSYSGVQVLFGVDLEIREGEIVALLGTNGAGKSTILNAISGVVEPDGGNVWFEGQAITGEAPERTVARGIVQVPGGRGVFPRLTVEDNLAMGGFLLRKDKALLATRTAEVLDLFPRLRERYRQPAGVLSGGERQMLTLAQSFLLKPKLLLIDELSLGLAPTVVQELLVALREINAAGTAVVLVEQSVNVALTLADRAYFMEKGEVRFSGPTSDLLDRADLLRSVFLEGAGAHR
jgi:branched-chain amino acid transport system ATP-binding protein